MSHHPLRETNAAPAVRGALPQFARSIARPRLSRALAQCGASAVWLTAPIGAGKTHALARHARSLASPLTWYTISSEDSDAHSFTAALGRTLLDLSAGPSGPQLALSEARGIRQQARSLFGMVLAESPVGHVVLDDVHEADVSEGFCAALAGLLDAWLEHAGGGKLLIASRGLPPSPLARAVIEEKLALLDGGLLQLDEKETLQLLKLWRKPAAAGRDEARSVLARSEGWMACAALLARTSGVLDALPADGSEVLMRYLSNELIDRLPATQRSLLTLLAFFPRITPELLRSVDATLDVSGLRQQVQQLALPHSLDSSGAVRLHELVRALLQARFVDESAGDANARARLVELLWHDGELHVAAELARRFGVLPALERLTLRHAPELVMSGRLGALRQVLDQLGAEVDPGIDYWRGVVHQADALPRAQAALVRAFEGFEARADTLGMLLCATRLLEVTTQLGSGTQARWLAVLSQRPPAPLPLSVDAQVLAARLLDYHARAETSAEALATAERALGLLREGLPPAHRIGVCGSALLVYALAGRVDDAEGALRAARRIHDATHFDLQARLAFAYAEGVFHMIGSGSARAGLQVVEDTLATCDPQHPPTWAANVAFLGSLLAAQLGEDQRADRLVSLMEADFHAARTPLAEGRSLCANGRKSLRRGEYVRGLVELRRSRELSDAAELFVGSHCALMAEIECLIGMDRYVEAEQALQDLVAMESWQESSLSVVIDRDLLEARLAHERGEPARAEQCLRRGLAAMRETRRCAGGMLMRDTLERMVRLALSRGIEVEVARALVQWGELSPAPGELSLEWPHARSVSSLGSSQLLLRRGATSQQLPLPRLLHLLIALGPQEVSVERLSRALGSKRTSRAALDTALHRLRQSLGDDRCITLERSMVRLQPEHVWVDCWALLEFHTDLVRRASELSADEATHAAQQLLTLYEGPFTLDAPHPILLAAGERYAVKFVRCVELLTARLCQLAAPERAQQLIEGALEREPNREALYRMSIQISLQQGLLSEARQTFALCAQALRALRKEPSQDLLQLLAT